MNIWWGRGLLRGTFPVKGECANFWLVRGLSSITPVGKTLSSGVVKKPPKICVFCLHTGLKCLRF